MRMSRAVSSSENQKRENKEVGGDRPGGYHWGGETGIVWVVTLKKRRGERGRERGGK